MPTRSQEEILFAAHLLPALGLPGDLASVLRALKADEGSKQPWDVCVEVEGIPVSVDYDGQYYHSADRRLEKDAEKTMDRVQRSDKDVVARVRVGAPAYLGLWLTPEEERRCEVINIRGGLRPSQQVQWVMDELEEMLPGLAEARKEKVVAITGRSPREVGSGDLTPQEREIAERVGLEAVQHFESGREDVRNAAHSWLTDEEYHGVAHWAEFYGVSYYTVIAFLKRTTPQAYDEKKAAAREAKAAKQRMRMAAAREAEAAKKKKAAEEANAAKKRMRMPAAREAKPAKKRMTAEEFKAAKKADLEWAISLDSPGEAFSSLLGKRFKENGQVPDSLKDSGLEDAAFRYVRLLFAQKKVGIESVAHACGVRGSILHFLNKYYPDLYAAAQAERNWHYRHAPVIM